MRAVRPVPTGELPVARRLGEASLPSLRSLRGLPRAEGPGGSIALAVETFLDAVARFDAEARSDGETAGSDDAEPSAEHPILDAVLVTLGVPREAPREPPPAASPGGSWLAMLAPPLDAPADARVERDEPPEALAAVPDAVLATLSPLVLVLGPHRAANVPDGVLHGVPHGVPHGAPHAARPTTESADQVAHATSIVAIEPRAAAPTDPARPADPGGGPRDAGAGRAARADDEGATAGPTANERAIAAPTRDTAEAPAHVVSGAVVKGRTDGEPTHERADPARAHDAAPPSDARNAAPSAAPVPSSIEPGAGALPIVRVAAPSLPAPAEVPQREVASDRWAVREGYVAAGGPENRASIELAHPTLGALTLELAGETRRLSIEVAAPSLTAAIALRGAEEELRRDLAASGTDLGRFRVRTRSAPTPQDAASGGTWQPRPGHERRRS